MLVFQPYLSWQLCYSNKKRSRTHFLWQFSFSKKKFPDLISCHAMANPGEEMVCGQCGQTILGKAMKVFVSPSSSALHLSTCPSLPLLFLSFFILKFTSCGQEHNFICHHIPIPHSSSTYCSSKIHLEIDLDTQAGEKYWHEHHFICCDCGVRIRGDSKVRKILFFLGHFYYTLGNFG